MSLDDDLATERDAVRGRISRLTEANGIGVRDLDSVVEAALSNGLRFVSHTVDDARVVQILHETRSRRPELFAAPSAPTELPRGMSQELAAKLSPGEIKLWPTLTNFQRLQIQRRAFANEDRPTLSDEIKVRYGEDAPMSALSADERLRLAHQTTGAVQAPRKVGRDELPPAARAQRGQALLGSHDAHIELRRVENDIAHLRAKTKNDLPTFNLQMERDKAVARLEAKRKFILERNPSLRAA
jgi:hypothetical protein